MFYFFIGGGVRSNWAEFVAWRRSATRAARPPPLPRPPHCRGPGLNRNESCRLSGIGGWSGGEWLVWGETGCLDGRIDLRRVLYLFDPPDTHGNSVRNNTQRLKFDTQIWCIPTPKVRDALPKHFHYSHNALVLWAKRLPRNIPTVDFFWSFRCSCCFHLFYLIRFQALYFSGWEMLKGLFQKHIVSSLSTDFLIFFHFFVYLFH